MDACVISQYPINNGVLPWVFKLYRVVYCSLACFSAQNHCVGSHYGNCTTCFIHTHIDNSADFDAQIRERNDQVLKVLCQLRNQDAEHPAIVQEMQEINAAAQQEREMKMTRWTELLVPNNLRRLFIGVMLQVFQQWTGTNAIVSVFIGNKWYNHS